MSNRVKVGEFLTNSGKLRVSDPCYEKSTWCAGVVDNCVKGRWEAFTEKMEVPGWGNRNTCLVVRAMFDQPNELVYENLSIEVGVDSGQAGVFDEELYGQPMKAAYDLNGDKEYNRHHYVRRIEDARKELADPELPEFMQKFYTRALEMAISLLEEFDFRETEKSADFYDVCCSATLGDAGAGVVDYGAVSRSGFGDGSYKAMCARNAAGEVVEIVVDFGVEDHPDDEDDFVPEQNKDSSYFVGGKI